MDSSSGNQAVWIGLFLGSRIGWREADSPHLKIQKWLY